MLGPKNPYFNTSFNVSGNVKFVLFEREFGFWGPKNSYKNNLKKRYFDDLFNFPEQKLPLFESKIQVLEPRLGRMKNLMKFSNLATQNPYFNTLFKWPTKVNFAHFKREIWMLVWTSGLHEEFDKFSKSGTQNTNFDRSFNFSNKIIKFTHFEIEF